ncbi:hypothetical protein EJ04DRAFT_554959 [Polyplosphaeria fusca]|uniref:Zn(2)-C6 fungal-type domain-containing protein n=1 Tax=Polyplosphaeria fusca TaxID=682080 RepID=A0A9P4QUC4_9PLEO|nr:hypothetical protein EJ04DRAFT_554959 [Polyplosphaeria fusca]
MSGRASKERETTACDTCAKAKVRCEVGLQRGQCKRCARLDKACERQPPGAHKRKPTDKHWSRADILRLESKVDSVSNLLSVASQAPATDFRSPAIGTERTASSPTPPLYATCILPNGAEAVRLFNLFRLELSPYFPFVPVPPVETQVRMRNMNPLLDLAIMTVASQHDLQRQLDLARFMRQEISHAVLLRAEKNVALLQAILVFLGWNHVHHHLLGAQLFNLVHIMIAMVYELDLNKEPNKKSTTSAGAVSGLTEQIPELDRTLAERRAYLGVLYMSSVVKTYLKELEGIRFTKYAEICCQVLEEAKQYPSDAYLVRLVRLQQQADKVGRLLYSNDLEPWDGMSGPMSLTISSLEKETLELGSLVQFNLPQADILSLTYEVLKAYLYKISLDDRIWSPSTCPTTTTQRAHLLESCLAAIEKVIPCFFNLSPHCLLSIPYSTWAPVGHMMLTLSRLSAVNHGAWSSAYVSSILDFKTTCRRFAAKMDEVMAVGQDLSPPRHFSELFVMMRNKFKDLSGPADDGEETLLINTGFEDFDFMWDDWAMNGVFKDFNTY